MLKLWLKILIVNICFGLAVLVHSILDIKKYLQAIAKLFNKAGVSYRILGTEEKCNGDTARRLGNEYLAQMMMQENIEKLNSYKVKKIVTGCPHCYNSFKS